MPAVKLGFRCETEHAESQLGLPRTDVRPHCAPTRAHTSLHCLAARLRMPASRHACPLTSLLLRSAWQALSLMTTFGGLHAYRVSRYAITSFTDSGSRPMM